MNFYIDFEATQYTQRIISIGCVSEMGETFDMLVKPPKKEKITKFITTLTGITNDQLINAPTANEAFAALGKWIEQSGSGPHTFYCYGDMDKTFLGRTMNDIQDFYALGVATTIYRNLIDYSQQIFKCLKVDSISLRKIYTYLQKEELQVTHDALEDAEMLRFVKDNLNYADIDFEKLKTIQPPKISRPVKHAPDVFLSWLGKTKWEVYTDCPKEKAVIKCYNGENEKYFESYEIAALWCIRFCGALGSPKRPEVLTKIRKQLIEAAENNETLYKLHWKIMN